MLKSNILYILPPFTQLNTPYPSTAYLKGYTDSIEVDSYQCDLGIELSLKIFSKEGLSRIFDSIKTFPEDWESQRLLLLKDLYLKEIEPVVEFLQGKNNEYAQNIVSGCLPEGARFEVDQEELDYIYGEFGIHDKAKYIATLFLEDIGDFIQRNIDENFAFSRYAERIGRSASSFDEISSYLESDLSLIEKIQEELLIEKLNTFKPDIVFISVPFPGNLISAFRIAQYIKRNNKEIVTSLGGGYPNTELRSLSEPRVFNYFDFVTLDDGEKPVEQIIRFVEGEHDVNQLVRTYYVKHEEIVYQDNSNLDRLSFNRLPTPNYRGLLLDSYISVLETGNPMHRLWSDGVWLKLTMAHGCYWKKCSFCDINLSYIEDYEPAHAKVLVNRVEELIEATGKRNFHFVDEAAPPALMKQFALEIIKRGLSISWWTNIRFEKSFSEGLCKLLKESGCIAVSGGLEVASDRLLKLMSKGVSLRQVSQVLANFKDSGILVHAYLMYGFPSQTDQETIDSLEVVRQFFALGLLDSAFWHQFAMTSHSPVGRDPDKYKVKDVTPEFEGFADNDRFHKDLTGADHEKYSEGLKVSLHNYLTKRGLSENLNIWFDFKILPTSVLPDFIESFLNEPKKLKGNILSLYSSILNNDGELVFPLKGEDLVLNGRMDILSWINKINEEIKYDSYPLEELKTKFEEDLPKADWYRFLESYNFQSLMNSVWFNI